ncbi:MAG: thioredoxin domain-containing protein [Acidobacteriales bacterium]|nr:thioredoxin domain-containing protein [Terriglobales bacterium]
MPAADTKPAGKTAFDKAAMETYVRHLFVWSNKIKVEIGDPKPSSVPGLQEVKVTASAEGARHEEIFYASKDGQKIIRGLAFDVNQNPFKPQLDKLHTQNEPSFGTPGAPVVLVVFSDFECPYCKEEAKVLRTNLLSTYPKEVRLYFKNFPLTQLHPWAKPAAIAGRCVYQQKPDAFWLYHDWIFEHQGEITQQNLSAKIADFIKGKEIDELQLNRCMETKATEADVDRSMKEGQALAVTATPTVFVNGRQLPGQQASWPNLRAIIDFEIEYQKTAKNAGEDCGCEVTLPSPLN